VSYMAMSIRLSPSLTKAILFAAEKMSGPIGSGLKRILWKVYMRKYHSVEDSFVATAADWGRYNEDLKRALFTIKGSTLETSEEGLERCLDRATEMVISGTKKRMEEFSASLRFPTTVLFALGILLPMMMGAMLPLVSLGNLDLSYRGSGFGTPQQSGWAQPVLIILMMDFTFPLATYLYAMSILAKRPGTGSIIEVEDGTNPSKTGSLIAVSALALFLITIGLAKVDSFGPYLIILSLTLPASIHLMCTTHHRRKRRAEVLKMEREFPDALFQLGTRISEGSPPERAILETARSMKGAGIADLFYRMYYRTTVFGLTLEESLFGEKGLLAELPSRTVRAAIRSFIDAARKDPISAGQMMSKTSEYLRDLQRLEEDTRRRLRTSVDGIRMTSLFFAPIVMGVTFSLYALLVETFSRIGAADNMMAPNIFLIVLGVYLFLMAAIAMYFVAAIENGSSKTERDYSIGFGVLVSTTVFALSSIVGQLAVA
ncbi:MAG: type II secretion system F family protein, partial [Thermoplasmata archaeon]